MGLGSAAVVIRLGLQGAPNLLLGGFKVDSMWEEQTIYRNEEQDGGELGSHNFKQGLLLGGLPRRRTRVRELGSHVTGSCQRWPVVVSDPWQ